MYNKGYGSGILPPKRWPYKTWLAMLMTGDNHGPPRSDAVEKLFSQAAKELPNAKVRFGRLEDFYDAIQGEKAPIPTIRGDMPDSWIHGLTTNPQGLSKIRRFRPQIATMEILNSTLRSKGVEVGDVSKSVNKAYQDGIRFSEHTWGINSDYMRPRRLYGEAWKQASKKGDYKAWEDSWEEKGAFADEVESTVSKELNKQLKVLAASVDTAHEHIVVFNGLPWKRGGLVSFLVDDTLKRVTAVQDVVSKQVFPLSQERVGSRQRSFIAKDIPAGGYRTFVPYHGEIDKPELFSDADSQVIENDYFRITASAEKGAITSIIDKLSKRELVDTKDEYGFGSYLYERFGSDEVNRFLKQYLRTQEGWAYNDMGKRDLPTNLDYQKRQAGGFKLDIEQTANTVSLVMKGAQQGGVSHPFSVRVTLHAGQKYIDITWACADKQPVPEPEGGWLCLPFNLKGVKYHLGRTGGVTDPIKDTVSNSYKDMSCLQSGLAMVDERGYGVGVCPLDSPLVSLDRPGLWRFSKTEFAPERPRVFLNLYNNMWGTNYPQWLGGGWKSSVRIWSFENYDNEASLITPAMEARQPLVSATSSSRGRLPVTAHGVKVSRKGVRLSSFGKNPDGKGVLLRVWEKAGESSDLTITLPTGSTFTVAQPCDLRGQVTGEPVAIEDGKITIRIKAYAPCSLLLK